MRRSAGAAIGENRPVDDVAAIQAVPQCGLAMMGVEEWPPQELHQPVAANTTLVNPDHALKMR